MANLLDPGTWGWGSDYPTGESAALKQPTVLGTTTPQYQAPTNYYQPAGSPAYNDQQALANSQAGLNYDAGLPAPTQGGLNYDAGLPAPTQGGFDRMDFNANPGEGWWWDAANGWQQHTNSNDQQQAQSEYDRYREQTQNAINTGYDAYGRDLNNLIPYYQNEIQDRTSQIGQDFQPIYTGLQQARDAGIQKLGMARDTVERKSAESVQDLQRNLNQVMRNTGMQLGAMGAGDSSAARVMAPYAYTKMAGREFGGIQRQANDQFSEIGMKEVDLRTEYDNLYNQTELDKNYKVEQIRSSIGDQISQIRQMMTQVEPERQRALAGLSEQLMNEARNRLSGILAEDRAQKEALRNWALQRTTQLNDAKLQMQNNANFDPRQIVRNELQSVGVNAPSRDTDSQFLNPQLIRKRREELGI